MVPPAGLEPARFWRGILSALCLPISPRWHFKEPSLTTLSSYHILLTCQTSFSEKMVGMEGLEPPRITPADFESAVFAIPPHPR